MFIRVVGVFDSEDLDYDFWFQVVSRAKKLKTIEGDLRKGKAEWSYDWKEKR